jgi:hypothetical protein
MLSETLKMNKVAHINGGIGAVKRYGIKEV